MLWFYICNSECSVVIFYDFLAFLYACRQLWGRRSMEELKWVSHFYLFALLVLWALWLGTFSIHRISEMTTVLESTIWDEKVEFARFMHSIQGSIKNFKENPWLQYLCLQTLCNSKIFHLSGDLCGPKSVLLDLQ